MCRKHILHFEICTTIMTNMFPINSHQKFSYLLFIRLLNVYYLHAPTPDIACLMIDLNQLPEEVSLVDCTDSFGYLLIYFFADEASRLNYL